MIVAKLTAGIGLILFLAGSAGLAGTGAIAAGCTLLLIGATVAAVVLEGRDLQPAAALLYGIDRTEEPTALDVNPDAEVPAAA